MAVLVTRPQPDNAATLASLGTRGIKALPAPMLRFEPLPFHDDHDADYDAVIATSANALRAVDLSGSRLLSRPLLAVGSHTAEAARAAGFKDVKVVARFPTDGTSQPSYLDLSTPYEEAIKEAERRRGAGGTK